MDEVFPGVLQPAMAARGRPEDAARRRVQAGKIVAHRKQNGCDQSDTGGKEQPVDAGSQQIRLPFPTADRR